MRPATRLVLPRSTAHQSNAAPEMGVTKEAHLPVGKRHTAALMVANGELAAIKQLDTEEEGQEWQP